MAIETLKSDEKTADINPLAIEVYPGKSLSDLFKDTIESLDRAQMETLLAIDEIKEVFFKRGDESKDGNGFRAYDILITAAPLLKDFLAEYGNQAESKVKVATAVANIVKSQQATILNQMVNHNNNAVQNNKNVPSILERLKPIDPLKKSNEELDIKISMDDIDDGEESQENAMGENENVNVIHSPDYKGEKI